VLNATSGPGQSGVTSAVARTEVQPAVGSDGVTVQVNVPATTAARGTVSSAYTVVSSPNRAAPVGPVQPNVSEPASPSGS